MGWGRKGLAAAAVALSLCGLAACGSSGTGDSQSGPFTPQHHEDSGGGADQFIVPGADNSIQEYGAEAGDSEFEEIAAVFHNFFDARAEGKWAAACSYLAPSTAHHYEMLIANSRHRDKSCAGALAVAMSNTPVVEMREEANRADVGSVRVDGKQAFVIYTGAGGKVAADSILKEHGAWKVGSLTSTPLE